MVEISHLSSSAGTSVHHLHPQEERGKVLRLVCVCSALKQRNHDLQLWSFGSEDEYLQGCKSLCWSVGGRGCEKSDIEHFIQNNKNEKQEKVAKLGTQLLKTEQETWPKLISHSNEVKVDTEISWLPVSWMFVMGVNFRWKLKCKQSNSTINRKEIAPASLLQCSKVRAAVQFFNIKKQEKLWCFMWNSSAKMSFQTTHQSCFGVFLGIRLERTLVLSDTKTRRRTELKEKNFSTLWSRPTGSKKQSIQSRTINPVKCELEWFNSQVQAQFLMWCHWLTSIRHQIKIVLNKSCSASLLFFFHFDGFGKINRIRYSVRAQIAFVEQSRGVQLWADKSCC